MGEGQKERENKNQGCSMCLLSARGLGLASHAGGGRAAVCLAKSVSCTSLL